MVAVLQPFTFDNYQLEHPIYVHGQRSFVFSNNGLGHPVQTIKFLQLFFQLNSVSEEIQNRDI